MEQKSVEDQQQINQQVSKSNKIWNEVVEQQSKFDISEEVKMRLEDKYSLSFNFFLSKPINQIVYQLTSCSVTQAFLDSRFLAHQAEFLKRPYRLETQQGIQQIYDRIRMLGEFYNMQDKRWKSQYPTMIVTDTKSIFEKRNRRLKKITAGQGSSDQTQQKSSFYCYSFETQNFLKDLSNIQDFYYKQKNQDNQISFDSEVHEVYSHESQVSNKLDLLQLSIDQLEKPVNIFSKQSDIGYLVCDFQEKQYQSDNNSKKNIQVDKVSQKSVPNQSIRQPLNSFDIENIYQSSNVIQDFSKQNQKQKKILIVDSYLNLFTNKYRNKYIEGDLSKLTSTDLKTQDCQKDQNQNYDLNKIDQMIEKQKQQKNKNRKKIRQKAEQLLRKVRGSSEIH